MADMSRVLGLALIIALAVSSMLCVGSVLAQSTQKPSVPEMNLTLLDEAVRVTIKNQPYVSYNNSEGHVIGLYYHLRIKDNAEENWHYTTYNVGGYRATDYFWASDGEYTTIDIPYSGNFLGFYGKDFLFSSGKVDFEVEALGGYSDVVVLNPVPPPYRVDDYGYVFNGELSGWSNPQTVQIAEPLVTSTPAPTFSPTPTAPVSVFANVDWEKVGFIGLIAAVAVLAVAVAMLWRRLPRK